MIKDQGETARDQFFQPSLKFTIEVKQDRDLPFLDMKIILKDCRLASKWYTKPTDTGLVMDFYVLTLLYKRAVASGCVHRIFRSLLPLGSVYSKTNFTGQPISRILL